MLPPNASAKILTNLETTLNHVEHNLREIDTACAKQYDKLLQCLHMIEEELIDGLPDDQEISVTGQFAMLGGIDKSWRVGEGAIKLHKLLHNSVSKVGKSIDRYFQRDVGGLFNHEKDIETDKVTAGITAGIVYDFLMSEGRPDIAHQLRKEAYLRSRRPEEPIKKLNIERILQSIRERDVFPAIDWLVKNAPEETKLRYDLHRQQIIKLMLEGKEMEALKATCNLHSLGSDCDTPLLMGALVMGPPAQNDPRYSALFNDIVWERLESRLTEVMSAYRSNLSELIDAGRQSLPMLVALKTRLVKPSLNYEDELPLEIRVQKPVHSTFTCPILKEQSSERNPPMKLACGHVISNDALMKLATTSRQMRLKCPYCPKESAASDARKLHFNDA